MLTSRIRYLIDRHPLPAAHKVVLVLFTSVIAFAYAYALLIYSYGPVILHCAHMVARASLQVASNL